MGSMSPVMLLKQKAESMVNAKQALLIQTIAENEAAKIKEVETMTGEEMGLPKLEKSHAELVNRTEQRHVEEVGRLTEAYRATKAKLDEEAKVAVEKESARYGKAQVEVEARRIELQDLKREVSQKASAMVIKVRSAAQVLKDRIRSQTSEVLDGIWLESMSEELRKKVQGLPTPDELKADGLKALLPMSMKKSPRLEGPAEPE